MFHYPEATSTFSVTNSRARSDEKMREREGTPRALTFLNQRIESTAVAEPKRATPKIGGKFSEKR